MKKKTLRNWIILALGLIILLASLYTVISQSSRDDGGPLPTDPQPTQTQPTAPTPTETQPTETQPTEPLPTEPQPTEPQPTEPQPTEPQPTEPLPTEPQPTEPQPTEPQPTEPQPTEPPETQPTETTHQHSYKQTVKQPTCTEKGYTTHTCACGDSYSYNEKAPLGHDYKSKVVAPTYDAEGYTQHTCSRCGKSYKDSYTDKLVKPTEPQPTETQPTEPQPTETQPTEPQPTETQPTETVHQHTYSKKVTKPTCTAKGYTTYTCACGDTYKADEVAAAGHQYEDTVTNPTCTEKGYTTHTCSVCGYTYKDSTKSALGHKYKSKVVAPTFDAKGYTKYTCSRCGKTYKDNYTAKLTATVLLPEASGTLVKSNKYATIDYSNTADGYVMVKYTEETTLRLKVQVIGPSSTYTYDIQMGQWATLPLTEGDGSYKIKVLRNKSGNTYSSMLTATVSVELADEFAPFLRPNLFVNYEDATKTITKGATLVVGKSDTLEKVEAIFKYVTTTLSYDYDKAESVTSSYMPELDKVLAAKKGICSDYAALMAAMLRTQGIPCKVVVGYADDAYHAWISVWSPEKGWVVDAIYFNGKDWKLMDPTYTSTTGEPEFSYVKYTAKYAY